MKLFEKNGSGYIKTPFSSKVFYVAGSVIGLIAVSALVNNIVQYTTAVAGYVDQGYTYAEVTKQLIPNQLLPGLFEPIAVYGGIAFILFGIGIINRMVSKQSSSLQKVEDRNVAVVSPTVEKQMVPEEKLESFEELADQKSESKEV